jgi:hypothetical protein
MRYQVRFRQTILLIATILFHGFSIAQSTLGGAQLGPIAMDRYGLQAPLYVLDSYGRIFVSSPSTGDQPTRLFLQLPQYLRGVDIVSTHIWSERESIYIASYPLSTVKTGAIFTEYSTEGEKRCEWYLPSISSGFDVDVRSHSIFASGSQDGMIYRIELPRSGCPSQNAVQAYMKLPTGKRLGAITIDQDQERLFVADLLDGSVYTIDIAKAAVLSQTHGFGQPTALLYGKAKALFVADIAGRTVWRLDSSANGSTQPVMFSHGEDFIEPTCLVFDSHGNLVVGDRALNVLFTVGSNGIILSKTPLVNPGRQY